MAELERFNQAQLNSALTERGEHSRRSLSTEDSSTLLASVEELTRRYPSQDQEGSIKEYFLDFEQLALKYSLPKVVRALEALRIKPGQKFFPRPDEVAEEIEEQRESRLADAVRSDGDRWTAYWRAECDRIGREQDSPEFKAWLATLGKKDS